ncbi:MAG: hypothetical protein ACFFB2_07260 [Promethearchaeota archaeon]
MITDPWISRGLDEIKNGHWFDGFQMLQGAIQRAFRYGKPDQAKVVISKAVPLFTSGNQKRLACELVLVLIMRTSQKVNERAYAELISESLVELTKASLDSCVQTICNRIIIEKVFQRSEFLSQLQSLILEANYPYEVISSLYYCYAGLLCYKKDYVLCFETLYSWSKTLSVLSPKMRTYLTLAEINAYEIEDCGQYLKIEEPIESDDKIYLEIANRIFDAVQASDESEFHFIVTDYPDFINPKKDGLLKALCEGISEILHKKPSSGLFSLFKQ